MISYFTMSEGALLFRMFLAFILVEFFIFPKLNAVNRTTHKYILIQSGIIGMLGYILITDWPKIYLIFTLAIGYGLVKLLEQKLSNRGVAFSFVLGNILQVASLLLNWILINNGWELISNSVTNNLEEPKLLAIISGYLLCTLPYATLVGKLTQKWQDQVQNVESLDNAGKWIGIAERILIFTFVITGQGGSIGFLIAAKSLLRYRPNEAETKHSEYVLIGTLLSYGLAILTGAFTLLFFYN